MKKKEILHKLRLKITTAFPLCNFLEAILCPKIGSPIRNQGIG